MQLANPVVNNRHLLVSQFRRDAVLLNSNGFQLVSKNILYKIIIIQANASY